MDTTPTYVAEQIAREYTRDRIRDAEAYRAARTARIGCPGAPQRRPPVDAVTPVRRWRILAARTSAA